MELILEEGSAAYVAAKAAIAAAIAAKWPKAAPANLNNPIKDPDAPSLTRADGGPARRGPAYETQPGGPKRYYLRVASGFDFPCWIGKDRRVPTADDIYSGGIWLVVAKFAAYQVPGAAPGITCYLELAWRTAEGTRISSSGFDADSLDVSDVKFDEVIDNPFAAA